MFIYLWIYKNLEWKLFISLNNISGDKYVYVGSDEISSYFIKYVSEWNYFKLNSFEYFV